MDLEWYLLVVARAAGMLAEFGTERRAKSRGKTKPRGKGNGPGVKRKGQRVKHKGMFSFPFFLYPFP